MLPGLSLPPFAVILALTLILSGFVSAQPPASEAEVAPAEDPTAQPDELVIQLESAAARGGVDGAKGIAALARLGKWEQVDRWLAEFNQVNDTDQLAKFASAIGNNILLRISLQDDLSEASTSALKKMTDAFAKVSQSPKLLRQAISNLTSGQPDTILDASRVLLAGGNASTQEISSAIGRGLPQPALNRALEILARLDGIPAIRQLALYGSPEVQVNALSAMSALSEDGSRDLLVANLFLDTPSPPITAQTQAILLGSSGPSQTKVEREDAIAFLAANLKSLLGIAAKTPNGDAASTLWSVATDRASVTSQLTKEIFHRYRDAYDASQLMRRLSPLPASASRLAIRADLSYRLMVDIDWGDQEQIKEFQQVFFQQTDLGFLSDCLSESLAQNEIPASVGLLRVMSGVLANRDNSAAMPLLHVSSGKTAPLVNAARSPNPRVRYEAAELISSISGEGHQLKYFAGSSYVRKTLAEMARLTDRPRAILVETRPAIALQQSSLLSKLGFDITLVHNARQAEEEIAAGGDIRLLVSKIRIADLQPAELVDRTRRLPNGNSVPIVFFNDEDAPEKSVRAAELETTRNRWADGSHAPVYLVQLPGDIAAYRPALVKLEADRRLEAMTISDRARFRQFAAEKLP